MPDPTPAPMFWQNVLSQPAAVVSLIAVLVNILICFINAGITWITERVLGQRRRFDRKYQLEFTFYQNLVLSSIPPLLRFATTSQKQFDVLLIEIKKKSEVAEPPRAVVEQAIEALDREFFELQSEKISLIRGYSPKLGEKTSRLLEKTYDGVSNVFSKLDAGAISPEIRRRHEGHLAKLCEEYSSALFQAVKNFSPTVDCAVD